MLKVAFFVSLVLPLASATDWKNFKSDWPFKSNNKTANSATNCGDTLASYGGEDAKSNGADQHTGNSCGGMGSYGLDYQCAELAVRYFAKHHGVSVDWGAISSAKQMCKTHPSSVSTTTSPKGGDLIVLSRGIYGHVAVVTSSSGSSVSVIEQNADDSGRNSYSFGQAECFLTA